MLNKNLQFIIIIVINIANRPRFYTIRGESFI